MNTEIAVEEEKEKRAKAEKELATKAAAPLEPSVGSLEIPNPAAQSQPVMDAVSGQSPAEGGQNIASLAPEVQPSAPSDLEDKA